MCDGTRSAPAPTRMTFDEFLAWSDGAGWAEWVDGEVITLSPASAEHQRLRDFLLTLLRLFVEGRGLGEVLGAPCLMRLPTRPSGREPDLLFVATSPADRVKETYLDGPADLVVEIVSPESEDRDRGDTLAEYQAAGIPEYWLIDPARREAVFYQRSADGAYRPGPVSEDGWYRSRAVEGFRLAVAWLWQRPPVLEALALAQGR